MQLAIDHRSTQSSPTARPGCVILDYYKLLDYVDDWINPWVIGYLLWVGWARKLSVALPPVDKKFILFLRLN